MKQCELCKKNFKSSMKIDGKWHILKSRKYCLECSPFGKHNTKKLINLENKENIKANHKKCTICKEIKHISCFHPNGKKRFHSYCRNCNNRITVYKKRGNKKRMVEHKGGKCSICGYCKNIAALEFHHLEKDSKITEIAKFKNSSISEKVMKELDKCILVCANCHRELHSKLIDDQYVEHNDQEFVSYI